MSKFEVGQEVLFDVGYNYGMKGVVVDPHYQVSQSDWPEVVVQYGERRLFVDIDDVRPAVDPYEYNIEGTDVVTGKTHIWRTTWEPTPDWLRGEVEKRDAYDRQLRNAGGSPEYTRRLVKRRKAGPVEDV